MTHIRNTTTALVLGLAIAAFASPALAQHHVRTGPAAHEQNFSGAAGEIGMTRHRAGAIRACSALASRYSEPTYGNLEFDQYRGCMMEHGESE